MENFMKVKSGIVFLKRVKTKNSLVDLCFQPGDDPAIVVVCGQSLKNLATLPVSRGLPMDMLPESAKDMSLSESLDFLINDVSPRAFTLESRAFILGIHACLEQKILDSELTVLETVV